MCDNGALIGDLEATRRKHTSGLNLQELVGSAIDEFMLRLPDIQGLYDWLSAKRLTDIRAKALIHDAFLKHEVMAVKYLPKVSERFFRSDEHREQFGHLAQTRWGLYNAHTDVMGRQQPIGLQTQSFHALGRALCN